MRQLQKRVQEEDVLSLPEIDVQILSPPKTNTSKAVKLVKLREPFDEATFGGLLTEEQADQTAGTPTARDRRLFEASLAASRALRVIDTPTSTNTGNSRNKKRKRQLDEARIEVLHFGANELHPWYSAPFPAEYFEGAERGYLWMCERCLKYIRSRDTFSRHVAKCRGKLPPGWEIYRKDNLSIFEVNGRFSKEYCQRLCLLAKLFLDHKTLYYDVETFIFYILIEWHPVAFTTEEPPVRRTIPLEPFTYSFCGYFSKEKSSPLEYNLSCIMTLPHHQRRGFGSFMMDFSYLLTRKEGKLGTPEKPLSDLGLIGYVRYWSDVVSETLYQMVKIQKLNKINLMDIAEVTGMTPNDVAATLEHLHLMYRRPDGTYTLCMEESFLEAYERRRVNIKPLRADPAALFWVPYTCIR